MSDLNNKCKYFGNYKYLYRIEKGRDNIYHIEKYKIIYSNKNYIYIKEGNDELTKIAIFGNVIEAINDYNIHNAMYYASIDGTQSKYAYKIDLKHDINYYNESRESEVIKLRNQLKNVDRNISYYYKKRQEIKSKLGELLKGE